MTDAYIEEIYAIADAALRAGQIQFFVTRWVSINIVLLVGLVYCSIAVHTTGFGSDKQLLALLLVQGFWRTCSSFRRSRLELLRESIARLPRPRSQEEATESSGGHVIAHAFGGFVFAVGAWILAAPILFVTKRIIRR
jgi:hypothetical protein